MARRAARVVLVGYGSANRAVMELILQRPWLEVVGIVVGSAAREGEPASLRVPGAPADLRCSTDLEGTLRAAHADIAIVATHTRLSDVLPILEVVAGSGTPIVCTAEDLAFIEPRDSPEAARIVDLARVHGVPIVASGANPGFVLDLWPLTLASLAWDIERLRARRVVDVSVFGPRVRASLGIAISPEAFRAGIADGSVVGHAGFPESLRVLATGMGRTLERIEVVSEPILADRPLMLPDGEVVPPGQTAGADQRATGWYDGEPWLEISMTLHIAPPSAGLQPTDRIELAGKHGLHVTVDPGCAALLSTAAMLVNGLGRAMAAPPGVYRPGDLPVAPPWLGSEPPPWVPLRA